MKDEDLLSGLKALEERANIAHRKIEYNSVIERLTRRVTELEEKMATILEAVRKI